MHSRVLINNDVLTGFGTAVIAIFGWYNVRNIPFQGIEAGLGPAFYPTVILVLISLLSVSLIGLGIFKGVKRGKEISQNEIDVEDEVVRTNKGLSISKYIYFFLVIIFPIVFPYVGLLVTITIFLLIILILLETKIVHSILITVGTSLFFYLVFGLLFNIRMF